jgi:hypothetical protein
MCMLAETNWPIRNSSAELRRTPVLTFLWVVHFLSVRAMMCS